MKPIQKSRPLQIYMKPGIRDDDLLIKVWDACSRLDRPQDVFRSMLKLGLMAMVEGGLMPESVIDECDLDVIVERKKRKTGKAYKPEAEVPPAFYPPQPAPQAFYPQPQPLPYPTYPRPDEAHLRQTDARRDNNPQDYPQPAAIAPSPRPEIEAEQSSPMKAQPQKDTAPSKPVAPNFSGEQKFKLSPDLM